MIRATSIARAPRASLGVVAAAALLAGCLDTSDFEVLTEVTDLRVLAMRLDPPEVELPLDEGAEPTPVSISALVVEPGGEPVVWRMATCPRATTRGCEPWEEEGAEPGFSLIGSGRVDEPRQGEAPQAVLSGEHSFSPRQLMERIEEASLEGLGGTRPIFEVVAESAGVEERAYKRLQISLPDIAFRMLLHEAGIPICDERGLPEGCIDYRTRLPNTNPAIEGFGYQRLADDGTRLEPEPMPEDGPLVVAPEERIWIVPAAAEGSAESYQTLSVSLEDRSILVEDRTEMLVWSWFTTAGDLGRARTEADRTRGEENVWTAPVAPPEDEGDVWLWVVLRDNRGGVDFDVLHLRVEG